MTSVYDANGRLHPVTVIAAGDNVLLRRLTNENEGYSAVQVGFSVQKERDLAKRARQFQKSERRAAKARARVSLKADLPEGE